MTHVYINFVLPFCTSYYYELYSIYLFRIEKTSQKTLYYKLCNIYFFRIKEKIAKTFDNLDDINIFSLATLCIYRKFIYFITVLLKE